MPQYRCVRRPGTALEPSVTFSIPRKPIATASEPRMSLVWSTLQAPLIELRPPRFSPRPVPLPCPTAACLSSRFQLHAHQSGPEVTAASVKSLKRDANLPSVGFCNSNTARLPLLSPRALSLAPFAPGALPERSKKGARNVRFITRFRYGSKDGSR